MVISKIGLWVHLLQIVAIRKLLIKTAVSEKRYVLDHRRTLIVNDCYVPTSNSVPSLEKALHFESRYFM